MSHSPFRPSLPSRLSKLYHPDTTELPLETASLLFIRLQTAYDTLSDDTKRAAYDAEMTAG